MSIIFYYEGFQFSSHHPVAHKRAVVLKRADSHCVSSDDDDDDDDITEYDDDITEYDMTHYQLTMAL